MANRCLLSFRYAGMFWHTIESLQTRSEAEFFLYFFYQNISEFLINTYSMKQPDLYYFETIKMTSQA